MNKELVQTKKEIIRYFILNGVSDNYYKREESCVNGDVDIIWFKHCKRDVVLGDFWCLIKDDEELEQLYKSSSTEKDQTPPEVHNHYHYHYDNNDWMNKYELTRDPNSTGNPPQFVPPYILCETDNKMI